MKKFLAIFIAMLLIGCTKSDNTKENQNNNTKQSSDSSELIEKNLTADSKPAANNKKKYSGTSKRKFRQWSLCRNGNQQRHNSFTAVL